jgi:hypothetical protein
MKQYVLFIHQPQGEPPPAEHLARIMRDVEALLDETKKADAWVFNAGLVPPGSSTVVRTKDGPVLVTDGPFAEAKEFIGGFVIVRAPDLDGALVWAEKLSRATTLPIEVRPVHD